MHAASLTTRNRDFTKKDDKYILTYAGLAKILKPILCNDIVNLFYSEINGKYIEPEIISGCDYDNENVEIFQYYIVDSYNLDLLKKNNEIIYYIDYLDMYIWGVTHYGTPWENVNTNIEIDAKNVIDC